MRRAVLILPDWLSGQEYPSFLRVSLPGLEWLTERSSIRKCVFSQEPQSDKERGQDRQTPEAAWLGLDPSTLALQDGPLTVSALGADPPADSVHFHLSLMSLAEGKVDKPAGRISEDDLKSILDASKRLNTKSITVVAGEQFDHGLVWEGGSIEFGTFAPAAIQGKDIGSFLPEGDGEFFLRRFIDDSVNLLSELDLTRRREEEGLEPLNLWWPWGQGFRVPVPNLALRRGEVAWVESNSMRLQGLARLAGYRHGDRTLFGWGVRTNLEQILLTIRNRTASISLIDAFTVFRQSERWEEGEWLTREIERRLLEPLAEMAREEPLNLSIIACPAVEPSQSASEEGLALFFSSGAAAGNTTPFDERALEQRGASARQVWQAVAKAF